MLKRYPQIAVGTAFALCLSAQVQAAGSSGMMNDHMLQELKRMIQQQQAQLDKQAAEIAALKQQLSGTTEILATKADKEEVKGLDKMVPSSLSNVKLSLYGQINRAGLYGNNGDSSKWYFVDNINSQTRLGVNALADLGNAWTTGGRIEYGILSNASTDVNQLTTNNATETTFNLRWAEVFFANEGLGKLSLGKGDSASNNSSEVDLSGTAVASFSEVADMGGAMLFFDGTTTTLATIKIKDVFNNFDGLSRTDRLRYDTPAFGGFSLATSYSSGDAFDGALLFNRKFGETKVAAAFAAASPNDLNDSTSVQYGGSASVLLPMGLNATVAGGVRDLDQSNRDNPTNWYTKLGYQVTFYEAATTSFSVDYGETADLRQEGDTAKTWAVAAVHNLSDWGTEIYLAYRNFKLDSDAGDFDDIYTVWAGARVKF